MQIAAELKKATGPKLKDFREALDKEEPAALGALRTEVEDFAKQVGAAWVLEQEVKGGPHLLRSWSVVQCLPWLTRPSPHLAWLPLAPPCRSSPPLALRRLRCATRTERSEC